MVDWAHLFILFPSLDLIKSKEIKKALNEKNTKTEKTRDKPSATKSFQWIFRRQKVKWDGKTSRVSQKKKITAQNMLIFKSAWIYIRKVLIMGAEQNTNAERYK